MPDQKKIIVVGGGYCGIAAAYDLARQGHQVTILEKDDALGGLAGTFEISPGYRVEKFYHHWFTSDTDILDFLRELGLGDSILERESNTGLFYANSIFRLASPLDLLKFKAIPLIDRIRTGLMALYARSVNDWAELEHISAQDWIRKVGGRKAFEVMWKPLLQGKFGPEAEHVSAVWFWNKLKLRGGSRKGGGAGAESLAYFKGGFTAVCDGMKAGLEKAGVEVHLHSGVSEIVCENNEVRGVKTTTEFIPADIVLGTTPLPTFLQMTSSLQGEYRKKAEQIRFLGNVCLVLRLRHSLSSTYWLNVADPHFPFVGVIEHTNFDPPENYGGERIAYLSKYLPTSEALYKMSEDEVFSFSLPHIQRMFPNFSRDWVIGYKVWRAEFSQPVITKGYSKIIPEFQTPIRGLWLSTMAQVYPEDRGTNYAVRYGRKVAREIAATI